MDKRTYNFAVGIVLMAVAVIFFMLPYFLRLDAFIPFLFALVSFILGIGFFFMGQSGK